MRFLSVAKKNLKSINHIILILLLLLSPSSFAQSLEIISLQFRPAEEIAVQIKELYPEQQVQVIGKNQKLTVRASDQVISEIRKLVTSLDTPLHQFLISVSNDTTNHNQQSGLSGGISSSSGSSATNSSVNITAHNKSFKTRGDGNQSVTVLEGYSAYINAGQKKPIRDRRLINGQWVNSVSYIDMTRGFYIVPRLVGTNQVELKIKSQQNQASKQHSNEIDTTTIDTVQVVRLGEWVNIGGTEVNTNKSKSGIAYSTKQQRVDNQALSIKVELIGN